MSSEPPQRPSGSVGPPGSAPLADRIPGAVAHDVYRAAERPAKPPLVPPPAGKPSAWNVPGFILVGLFLATVLLLSWPQLRARALEHKVKPLVTALALRDSGARCPRYLTTMFGTVGSVSLDSSGQISDHTDLTAPVCDGLRRLYSIEGRAELRCLVTDGRCNPSARRSIVALSVVAHESMHLRGILDEAQAECASLGEGARAGTLAGLTAGQGQMIAYLHLVSLNPNTPAQYAARPETCRPAALLLSNPPGTPEQRAALAPAVEQTWIALAG